MEITALGQDFEAIRIQIEKIKSWIETINLKIENTEEQKDEN